NNQYELSLHDALPISASSTVEAPVVRRLREAFENDQSAAPNKSAGKSAKGTKTAAAEAPATGAPQAPAATKPAPPEAPAAPTPEDRKSTRLNSSHVKI